MFDEKARRAEEFNRQRTSWVRSQYTTIARNIHYLPGAILSRHYDLIDKILQWMLMPRLILMILIIFMGAVLPFFYFSMALKWWFLFATVVFIFALATPYYLVDDKWDKTFYLMPIILLSSVLSRFKIGQKMKAYVNKKL